MEVNFFGGDEWECFLKVVAELTPEYADGSGASAVCFFFSVFEDVVEEVFVWGVYFSHGVDDTVCVVVVGWCCGFEGKVWWFVACLIGFLC